MPWPWHPRSWLPRALDSGFFGDAAAQTSEVFLVKTGETSEVLLGGYVSLALIHGVLSKDLPQMRQQEVGIFGVKAHRRFDLQHIVQRAVRAH